VDTDAGLFSPVSAGTEVTALTSDRAYLRALLDAEAARARAQARLGAVPPPAAAAITAAITAAARTDRIDLAAIAERVRGGGNPVIPLVPELTAAVRELDPDAARYVHSGATSQDILDTALMVLSRRALGVIGADLDRTAAALGRLAARHRDTPAVGRTLSQHAVPTTFGLRAAGWYELAATAAGRVRALAATLPVSLGGAAGTLAGYVEQARLRSVVDDDPSSFVDGLVAAYAAETGLAEPVLPWHTLRVPVADLGATLALVTGALGKFAVDVLGMARTEVGEVAEPAGEGRGGSSAMAQKRNPVLATLIRSAALQVPALAAVLAQSMLAEDERPAGSWHAEWQPLRDCLRLAGGAAATAAELAEGLVVFPDRLRANLELTGSAILSERLVAVLGAALGKSAAEELLARATAEAERTGRPLAAVLAAVPGNDLTEAELAALLDPLRYLGAAGHLVDRALAHREG
jgi:3-carboxy-cis,cis-muconate cycloisomerase